MQKVDKNMVISEILMIESELAPILMASGMHCLGCHSSQFETLEEACFVHGIDVDNMVDKLNEYLVLIK
jgi:hybrid cluster-associated redox disulfide protein